MRTEKRTFYGPDIDIPSLSQALVEFFARDGYRTQMMPASGSGVMVQAGKEDSLRKSFGMSSALTAVLTMENEYVAVEMGGAKWADKGVAAGIGAVIFFPALITAGVGAYQQSQLQTHAWQFIEQYIRTNSAFGGSSFAAGGMGLPPQPAYYPNPLQPGTHGPPTMQPNRAPAGPPAGPPQPVNLGAQQAAAPASSVCSQCNQVLPPGSKFCLACGAPASKTCFNCGQALQANARFCNNCGSPATR